ncbi:hypothetical protein A3D85_01550 [Candidatus Amesbacteria bacterium RIFCSPHIGHO2_02_FULL_47_9]|uniref:Glycosyltransferase RgtA/B/C/D-like domain-containing protein n=1 Tax=Candidatus Amesbacteria bacterium RIFCSPHIGHO2_01_FULL_48_32b TaxID=1797253 RepID=A0A1F4YCX7_9BACT|nr:MAG: hypothetical protein A2876_04505 [Candidatus Amesbacteria bacterium RIFCSPHIGHO2_01_FULL_48_32b]OGD02629.1 MAG: hypothetical protein A3D85_01550 [Candidatus Amesbacteria bacterium RIFCSPHIGHO2_02_FULL_47_9]
MRNTLFLLLFISALFLRFYRFSATFVFSGELGDNLLSIRDIILSRHLPLLGPPTSHPWLSFGPLYYWLSTPILKLVDFNPLFFALISLFLLSSTLLVHYSSVSKLTGFRTALISLALLTISPAWIESSRSVRFFDFIPILFYPLWILLSSAHFFYAGLILGLMFNFHFSPLILVPASLHFIYLKYRKSANFFKFIIGLILPILPLFTNLSMLGKLAIWLPYRMAGLAPAGNQPGFSVIQFLLRQFLFTPHLLVSILIFTLTSTGLILVFRHRHQPHLLLLLLFFTWGILGIGLHRLPPSHYYLPLYPIPVVLVAFALTRLPKIVTALLITSLLLINFPHLFSPKLYYYPSEVIYGSGVQYPIQLSLSRAIITDARSRQFSLSRVGPFDVYAKNYAQNFEYLLWYLDNPPVPDSRLHYTIYEAQSAPESSQVIFSHPGLAVVRSF